MDKTITTPESYQVHTTRGLPKTNQRTVYAAGDDGTYQAGWWVGRTVLNNRQRFLIRTIAGDDVVIDRATGLMWARDWNLIGGGSGIALSWANAILVANGTVFAGFSDWRLPNALEMTSLYDFEGLGGTTWYPEFNLNGISFWTSTTYQSNSAWAYIVALAVASLAVLYAQQKTSLFNILCVRKGL